MVKAIESTEEFNQLIASGQKVIVDYHATWCGYVHQPSLFVFCDSAAVHFFCFYLFFFEFPSIAVLCLQGVT